jgi:hypothetical protein
LLSALLKIRIKAVQGISFDCVHNEINEFARVKALENSNLTESRQINSKNLFLSELKKI